MNKDDDIGFTFDPKQFLSALKEITGGLTKVESATKKAADHMGSAMTWALIKVQALGAVLQSAMGAVKQYVPEIGQVLGIAKDVFFKNFLWPLRQALGPYLQKLLDWVRDSRSTFVKWGQTLANIFQIIVVVVKNLWAIGKQVWSVIQSLIKSVTGGSVSDAVNLIITKLALVVSYLSHAVSGIIDWIKTLAPELGPLISDLATLVVEFGKAAWNDIKSFFSGLEGWIKPAVNSFDSIVKSVTTIFDRIFGGDGGGLNGFFRFLGDFSGAAITGALKMVQTLLDSVVAIIDYIKGDKIALAQDMINLKSDVVQFGRVFGGNKSQISDEESRDQLKKQEENNAVTKKNKSDYDFAFGNGAYDRRQERLRRQSFGLTPEQSFLQKANLALYGNEQGNKATGYSPIIHMGPFTMQISNNAENDRKLLDDLTGALRSKMMTAMAAQGMNPW